MKYPMHDGRASGHREQFAIETDQSARRAVKERAYGVPPRGLQLDQFRASFGERIHHVADEGLGDIDLDFFDGLEQPAALRVFAQQHPRAPDRQFEALAAHRLDQHGQLQLAAAGDLVGAVLRHTAHLDCDIAFGLACKARLDHAGGELRSLASGKRRVVDRKHHRDRRRIDRLGRDRDAAL